ncbi:serine/threonine protein kinase [Ruania suaedae]|uniref:serine/threonine-protein kinase n=1 Tax=Ruania suaedae TaxID=2897774 RepID=UPI001E2FE14D|nr:serine/threonine-protein kinase [Ruania suaedae]UFU02340.1 serine/threonine protein kinase [Ruania suaedae]
MRDLDPPSIPGFRPLRALGHGGFSDVYLYEQQMPRRQVAIKVLRTESLTPAVRARFATEAHLMARLSGHTGIADILAADVDEAGEPYLVMEHCPGGSLGDVYRTRSMSVAEVLRLGVRLACALESAHRQGIVHRDVKPANILLTEYGVAVLADFGISTVDDAFPGSASTRLELDLQEEASSAVGMSLPWAAPEALARPPVSDARSDQYGLAATLYSLLESRSPHEVPGGPNGSAHLTGRIRSGFIAAMARTDVPESLQTVLRAAMSYDPGARYESCLALALALQQVQREIGESVTALEVPLSAGPLPGRADPMPTIVPGHDPAREAARSDGGPSGPGGPGGPGGPAPWPTAEPGESTWVPAEHPAGTAAAPGGVSSQQVTNAGAPAGAAPVTAMAPPVMPAVAPAARTAGRVALIAAVTFVVLAFVAGGSMLVDWISMPHFTGRAVDNAEVSRTAAGAYEVSVPEGLEAPEQLESRILESPVDAAEPALEGADEAVVSVDTARWTPGGTVVLNPREGETAGTLQRMDAETLRGALALGPDEEISAGSVVLAAAPAAYFVNVTPELGVSASESTLVLVSIVE